MLAGHYAAAFAGKAARPGMPLWVFFVAAQGVDILWAALVMSGVERAGLDPTLLSNPLVAEHMPYSHSLLGNLAGAVVAAAVVWLWRRSWRDAAAVGLVALSHWFFDLPMHRQDMTLYGVDPKIGLALWNYPIVAHTLELALLALSVLLVRARLAPDRRRGVGILFGVLVAVQLWSIFGPLPTSVAQMTASLIVFWIVMPVLAAWRAPTAMQARQEETQAPP